MKKLECVREDSWRQHFRELCSISEVWVFIEKLVDGCCLDHTVGIFIGNMWLRCLLLM